MKIFFALIAAMLLAACGPIYETQYDYIPPHNRGGQVCLEQCNTSKAQCRTIAGQQAENERLHCELDANADYEHCQGSATNHAEADKCTRRSCAAPTANSGPCDEDFRICYAGCGGTVTSRQVCTFNCPTQ